MRILRAWKKPKRKGFASVVNHDGKPPIGACVAHRCKRHEDVKPLNVGTDEQTECGACIAEDITNLLVIYNDTRDRLERACGALNLLSPGSGDAFLPHPVEEPDAEPETPEA